MDHHLSLVLSNPHSPLVSYAMLPGDHWDMEDAEVEKDNPAIFLCEIAGNRSILRPAYQIKDLDGKDLHFAVYTTGRGITRVSQSLDDYHPADQSWVNLPVGTTICIENIHQHYFMDGQQGIRLDSDNDTLNSAKILKCTMQQFLELNETLRKNGSTCSSASCTSEEKLEKLLRCAVCKTPYCSKSCQSSHWKLEHKKQCRIIAYLRYLNRQYGR
ncbi:hypothetical protein BDZ94DRAFT_1260526 [Collybia nuda]|uniref:MYND-type domain-containing protein n=1 Tax=Collybia nuda TaxID=64659 RepID=A0A9P5Y7F2_9AGAR|nr:hypothetical protein BDZ94DRAFT_1260526 [Collybia nuda]